jgi:hypothetical protein
MALAPAPAMTGQARPRPGFRPARRPVARGGGV